MSDTQIYNIDGLKRYAKASLKELGKSKFTIEQLRRIRELAKIRFTKVQETYEKKIITQKIKEEEYNVPIIIPQEPIRIQQEPIQQDAMWVSLPQEDIKKLSPDIDTVLIRSVDNKTHIVWSKYDDTFWEAYMECNSSFKKMIMIALYNPAYRGTLTRKQYNKMLQQGLNTCRLFTTSVGDSHATRQVIAQLSRTPESPNSQSKINNRHLP